jgi:hypothetical protein
MVGVRFSSFALLGRVFLVFLVAGLLVFSHRCGFDITAFLFKLEPSA